MKSDYNSGFCQRNLKPVYSLLVVLIAITIGWALFVKGGGDAGGHGGSALHAAVVGHGPVADAQQAQGAVVNGAAGGAQGAAGAWVGPNGGVDAVTMATPQGGPQVITIPVASSLSPGTSMQLVAGQTQSRHAYNTVSALILPCVVNIHAIRTPMPTNVGTAGNGARFAAPFDGVPEKFVRNKAYETIGSGVIIDSRGFTVTNYHVISEATDLLVSVAGRVNRDFPAYVVAVDRAADLALIKISGAPALQEARLGNSDAVQVGDWVLAFGSPFGLEQTVTDGIISNCRKSLLVEGVSYGQMLQTNAAINRGSSGGPLVSDKAEVIGINSAIYGPNGVFSGTGFAIPSQRVRVFLAQNSGVFNR